MTQHDRQPHYPAYDCHCEGRSRSNLWPMNEIASSLGSRDVRLGQRSLLAMTVTSRVHATCERAWDTQNDRPEVSDAARKGLVLGYP